MSKINETLKTNEPGAMLVVFGRHEPRMDGGGLIPLFLLEGYTHTDFLGLRLHTRAKRLLYLGRIRSRTTRHAQEFAPAESPSPCAGCVVQYHQISVCWSPPEIQREELSEMRCRMVMLTYREARAAVIQQRRQGSRQGFLIKGLLLFLIGLPKDLPSMVRNHENASASDGRTVFGGSFWSNGI